MRHEEDLPAWRDIRRALARKELLGKVRRGFFVEGLSGEQYAEPEAVEALRDTKLRSQAAEDDPAGWADQPMICLNAYDPVNPFGNLLPLTNEVGEECPFLKTAYCWLVLRGGRVVLLYKNGVHVLADLSRQEAEQAVRTLMAQGHVAIPTWNGHPIDVSPARHLLTKLGFVRAKAGRQGLVYDRSKPAGRKAAAEAEKHIPDVFEREGKERAPVEYNAEWLISRCRPAIRPKVAELIDFVRGIMPADCELAFTPVRFAVRYRGVKCMHPQIQQKQIYLHVTHAGWSPGLLIRPDTNLAAPAFAAEVLRRLARVRAAIDAKLARRCPPPGPALPQRGG